MSHTFHITYRQNGEGRAGHKFNDFYSVFIIAELLSADVVYDESWNTSHFFISSENYKQYTVQKATEYDYVLNIQDIDNTWRGMSYQQFTSLSNRILKAKTQYQKLLVRLHKVCRVKFENVYQWYKDGLINEDLYSLKIIPKLRQIYFGRNPPPTRDVIAIHTRRGDIATRIRNAGFTTEYYQKLINSLLVLNLPIELYCEDVEYQDLLPLTNVSLCIGGIDKLKDDHFALSTSRILVVGPSTFSTTASFINHNIVLFDTNISKFAPNYITTYPPNLILFTGELKSEHFTMINKALSVKEN